MKKIKKIILLLVLILIIPVTVFATGKVDSGGVPSSGGGGSGPSGYVSSGWSLAAIAFLRISLVDVETLDVKSEIYYGANHTSTWAAGYKQYYYSQYYFERDQYNVNGARQICGFISSGQYTYTCKYVPEAQIKGYVGWFYKGGGGLAYNNPRVLESFCKGSTFNGNCRFSDLIKEIITTLVNDANLSQNDYDNFTEEEITELVKYRIILEPIYTFRKQDGSHTHIFTTLKGISKFVIDNYQSPITDTTFLGMFPSSVEKNIYASKDHGLIVGTKGQSLLSNNVDGSINYNYYNFYEKMADAKTGYGYGVFYVTQSNCDPTSKSECCYDSSGNYNSSYSGSSSNYRCKNGSGETCNDLEACFVEEVCDVSDNPTLNCATSYDYNSSCSDTYSVTVSAPSECTAGTGTVSANVRINQTGKLTFSLPQTQIYSGGGFNYSVVYTNSVNWQYETYPSCPSVTVGYYSDYYCDSGDSLSRTTCTHTSTDNTDPENPVTTTTTYSATRDCITSTVYASNCQNDSDAQNLIKEAVTNSYTGLDNSSVTVTMPDSNVIGGLNSNTGTWECNSASAANWGPGVTLTSSCSFTLYNSYIKRDSGTVYYGDEYNETDYLSEGNKYFTPLKYETKYFPIKAVGSKLSSISGFTWGFTYECGVNCNQEFYDLKNGGYLFYYRPITLVSPFPYRDPGSNWYLWYVDNIVNQNRLLDTYDNLEYTLTLTNETIASIKAYNQTKEEETTGYLDYSINNNGLSNFIENNSYISRHNITKCKLGEFEVGCDTR